MRFLDEKFRKNWLRYVSQCVLAVLVLFVLMLLLNAKENTAVIASLGASSFIAFTMPHKARSRWHYLIGGYIIGIVSGFVCYHIAALPVWKEVVIVQEHPAALWGGVAAGAAIFVMVLTDLEHPPAAGVALGLVLNNARPATIVVVFFGIILLAVMKAILKRYMIDLL